MAPPNNPKVARVAMVYSRDTRTFVNTFHVTANTELGVTDLPTIANVFKDWWNTYMRLSVQGVVCLQQIQVRKYSLTDPLAYDLSVSPALCGTDTAMDPEPGSVALALSWRTGLAGRKYRGRFYLPGIGALRVNSDDSFDSAWFLLAVSRAAQLLTLVNATAYKLGVFHRGLNTITAIITVVADLLVDSQRRRLPNRGR